MKMAAATSVAVSGPRWGGISTLSMRVILRPIARHGHQKMHFAWPKRVATLFTTRVNPVNIF